MHIRSVTVGMYSVVRMIGATQVELYSVATSAFNL